MLKTGFVLLRVKADALEFAVKGAHAEVIAAREPIVQDMLENLASELAFKESEAASLRSRLRGLSFCSNGSVPQKLPRLAIDLLRNPPKNAVPPQINTPAARTIDHEKQAFIAWKRALESDAQAQLNLN